MARSAREVAALPDNDTLLDEIDRMLETLRGLAPGAEQRERFALKLRAFRGLRSRAGKAGT